MDRKTDKPSPEAKALSLFLMAYKSKGPIYKDKSRQMNNLWDKVVNNKLSKNDYLEEVENMLGSYGGYAEVVEKTVQFYINKTGEWKLKGDDKYCIDAKKVADRIMKK